MEKKYSVFVSSTYEDLKEHREKVIYSLVENNFFPVAMEFFQASSDNKWERIKKLIKDCDYFILIVGGRYGEIQHDDKSFIELEYDFALENNIPVNVFVVNSIDELRSKDVDHGEKRESLNRFIRKIQDDKISKSYKNVDDLKAVVVNSLNRLIIDSPRVGWIRGTTYKIKETLNERIDFEIDITEITKWINTENITIEYNPIGKDYSIFSFENFSSESLALSVKEVWDILRLKCLQELPETEIGKSLNLLIDRKIKVSIKDKFSFNDTNIFKDSFDNVIRVFVDRGLIEPSLKSKLSIKNQKDCYWKLSSLGEVINSGK